MNCLINSAELLREEEVSSIEGLIKRLMVAHSTPENEDFANECHLIAQELPLRLRKILDDFRNRRTKAGYLLLRGFPLDNNSIGPTPVHWDAPWINPVILREEFFQCLISSCVGDLFGWLTQENGRLLRHIVPIEADRKEQLGGSSDVDLLWHVEEAFHPMRADMMTIMCYRNFEQATTNICSLSSLDIPDRYWNVLS